MVDQWNLMTANIDAKGLHAVGDVEQSYRARLWHRRQGDHTQVMRFSHDYRAYEIETAADRALQTNGHLHRLTWAYRFSGPQWELSVAPVVAGSSNAGRHPKVIDAEFIFWQGFARYRRPWTPSVDAYWGVCRDDRFGSTRLTPVFGVEWRVNDQLDVTLGFPDTRLTWRMHPRLQIAGRHPSGGGPLARVRRCRRASKPVRDGKLAPAPRTGLPDHPCARTDHRRRPGNPARVRVSPHRRH